LLLAVVAVEVVVSKLVQAAVEPVVFAQVLNLLSFPELLTQLLLVLVALAVLVLAALMAVILFFLPLHLTAVVTEAAVIAQTALQFKVEPAVLVAARGCGITTELQLALLATLLALLHHKAIKVVILQELVGIELALVVVG
jgi:hypothetical protein